MGTRRLCKASKLDGSKCRVAALTDSEFCFFHDPSRTTDRKAAQSLGGHGNRMKTLDPEGPDVKIQNSADIIALLSETINQVLKGVIDPRVANAVGYLANIAIRAQEQNELEVRIRNLEANLENRIALVSGR
jgi:hypothetical protein